MQKAYKKPVFVLLFLLLTIGMLCFSKQSLAFALTGLQLWFNHMIPALLPFMILTNLLIGLNLTDSFVGFFKPFFCKLFRLDGYGVYALFVGFLCGFPMGAKVTADLLRRDLLTSRDASYLLAFCNNIGPVYFTGFVMLTLRLTHPFPFLFGMYGLAFLYGLFLRFLPSYRPIAKQNERKKAAQTASLLDILDDAIMSALYSIAKLGGYMIFFNLLNLLPHMLCKILLPRIGVFLNTPLLLAGINCLLEITSGINRLQDGCPLLVLILLPFGGFSCIAQTYSMIKGTGLSIKSYFLHKLVLTAITACYYLLIGPLLFS